VAFQSGPTEDNKNSGEIIEISIVSQFLTDIADGKHDGIPSLGITVQKLENPDFKLKLGMEEKYSGVLVINVDPESPARGLLKPGDVILSINRQEVDGDKKIELSKGIRTYFTYAIQTKQIGDIVTIKILRNSRIMRKRITLSKQMQFDKLVPRLKYSTEPTYFILGGLVFQPLTMNYLRTYGKDWGSDAPSYLLNYFAHGKRTYNRKEIIVLTQVLSDEINVGYDALEDSVISYVNNKQISTMKDLVQAFEEYKGRYHTIIDERGYKIVLDRKKVNRRGNKILKKYGIDADRSRDLE